MANRWGGFRDPEQKLSRNGQTKLGFKVFTVKWFDSWFVTFLSPVRYLEPQEQTEKNTKPREVILLDVVWEVLNHWPSFTHMVSISRCRQSVHYIRKGWFKSDVDLVLLWGGRRLTAVPLLGDIYYTLEVQRLSKEWVFTKDYFFSREF